MSPGRKHTIIVVKHRQCRTREREPLLPYNRSHQSAKIRPKKIVQLTNLNFLRRGVIFADVGPNGNILRIVVGSVVGRGVFSQITGDIVHLAAADLEVFRV